MTYKAVFNFKMYGRSYAEWSLAFHRFFGALPDCETSCDFAKGKAFAYCIDEHSRDVLKYLLRDFKGALRFYKEL